jgi:hypothetical protein
MGTTSGVELEAVAGTQCRLHATSFGHADLDAGSSTGGAEGRQAGRARRRQWSRPEPHRPVAQKGLQQRRTEP